MGEERKGQLNELSGSVRHRLQSTDHELSQLHDVLGNIKTSIDLIDDKSAQIKTSVDAINPQGRYTILNY